MDQLCILGRELAVGIRHRASSACSNVHVEVVPGSTACNDYVCVGMAFRSYLSFGVIEEVQLGAGLARFWQMLTTCECVYWHPATARSPRGIRLCRNRCAWYSATLELLSVVEYVLPAGQGRLSSLFQVRTYGEKKPSLSMTASML